MKRIVISVSLIGLIFGSLISFPAHVHWMVFIWLGLSLIASAKMKPMWPWLVACVLIIAIKRPGYALEFWMLSIVFIAVALGDWLAIRRNHEALDWKRLLIFALLLIVATSGYVAIRRFASSSSRQLTLDARPIACLGDSLTGYGYPQELEKLISVPVADFGVNGITTDDGIKMIPKVLAANPQLVVIELGGHDYNAGQKTRSATKLNLETLIEAFLEQDIAVILVEIPRGFVSDPYDGLERELSAKYDLQLIDDSVIRSFVFNSPFIPPGMWLDASQRYSEDGLHPNNLGNRHLARVVSKSLVEVFGVSVLE